MSSETHTITVPTVDICGIVNELDFLQGTDPSALDVLEAVERQAPADYWDCEDEEAETTLVLTEEQYAVVKPIIDAIAAEFDIDISAGIK